MIDPRTLKPGDRFIDEQGDLTEVISIGHGLAECLLVGREVTVRYIYSGNCDFFPWDTAIMAEPAGEAKQGESA